MTAMWLFPTSSRQIRAGRRRWFRRATTADVTVCAFDACDEDATTESFGAHVCALHRSLLEDLGNARMSL